MTGCKRNFILAVFIATVVSDAYQPPKQTTVKCNKDTDCTGIPYTFCSGNTAYNPGVCSCTFEYVLKVDGTNFSCLEEAKLFLDPCQIDDQCIPKFGEEAGCIQNKCRCKPEAHFINLKCWKSSKLGETCGSPYNCIATSDSECATGVCRCVPGFIGSPDKTKCLKIAAKIGEACEDNVQCSGINSQVTCQYGRCLCPLGYNPQGNSCVKPPAPVPYYPPPPPPSPPRHNNASTIRECVAMIFFAMVLFCVKI